VLLLVARVVVAAAAAAAPNNPSINTPYSLIHIHIIQVGSSALIESSTIRPTFDDTHTMLDDQQDSTDDPFTFEGSHVECTLQNTITQRLSVSCVDSHSRI